MQCRECFRRGLWHDRQMTKTYSYTPQNVCSRHFEITLDGNRIVTIRIVGGCAGNTQGVCRLCQGRTIEEVISLLDGIRCPGSRTGMTSCPDQLAQALKQIQTQERGL